MPMNTGTKWVLGVVILLIIVWVGISVSDNDQELSGEPIKIGVIAPLSGDFAGVGENVVRGIQTAEKVWEEKTGREVEIVIENDEGDATKGLSAYRKLTEVDGVNGLINVFTTTMDAIYDLTAQAGYPVMMEFFQANNVADDHVFQMTPGNDGVWVKYANYIKEADYDTTNFVIIHSQDASQESFAKAFAEAYGATTTLFVVVSDKNNLRTDATKIAALKPTILLFLMPPENGAILTKELLLLLDPSTRLIYDTQLFTGVSFYQDQLGGLSKINGAITILPEGDPDPEFIEAYKELFDTEPGFLADFGYDTLMVYLDTYSADHSKWINNLRAVNVHGASGQVKFDQNGIRLPDLVIKQVVDGELQTSVRLEF